MVTNYWILKCVMISHSPSAQNQKQVYAAEWMKWDPMHLPGLCFSQVCEFVSVELQSKSMLCYPELSSSRGMCVCGGAGLLSPSKSEFFVYPTLLYLQPPVFCTWCLASPSSFQPSFSPHCPAQSTLYLPICPVSDYALPLINNKHFSLPYLRAAVSFLFYFFMSFVKYTYFLYLCFYWAPSVFFVVIFFADIIIIATFWRQTFSKDLASNL